MCVWGGGVVGGSWVITHPTQVSRTFWEDSAGVPLGSDVKSHDWFFSTKPLPSYVIPLTRISRTSHPLAYRQIYARTVGLGPDRYHDRSKSPKSPPKSPWKTPKSPLEGGLGVGFGELG